MPILDVKSLSRKDFFASARALKIDRPELTQYIDLNERSFGAVPGDTFGEMCEQGEKLANRETKIRQALFAGQAAFTVGAGAVGLGLYGASLSCRKQVLERQPVVEAAHKRSDHLNCWDHILQDAERMAVEKNIQYKSSVERLAEGLKASSAVLLNEDSLQVGGVRVKRKS